MRISINPKLFEEFSDFSEIIILAKGVSNNISQSRDIVKAIKKEEAKILERSKNEDILALEAFTYWREVYSKMKASEAVPSHLALVRRVLKGDHIPNISPIVNYYNLFSLKNFISSGAEDLDNVYGDVVLERLEESTPFLEINSSEVENIEEGEICWHDSHSVTCKNWGWRQSERTKITKNTTNCYFVFDVHEKGGSGEIYQTIEEFARHGEAAFGGEWCVYKIDKENPVLELDYETKDISIVNILDHLNSLRKINTKGTKGLTKRKAESIGLVNENSLVSHLNAMVVNVLKEKYPTITEIDGKILENAQNINFGDFSSNIAFKIAPIWTKSPYDTALLLSETLIVDDRVKKCFKKIDVARNGFMNFYVHGEGIIERLKLAYNDFSSLSYLKIAEGRSILVESPSANPNKPLHVGHLLNVFLGKSLMEVFRRVGFDVYNDNIINDRGMPICKAIWALQKYGKDSSPEKENLKPDHFVGKYYVLGSNAFKESKDVENEVREILRKWEGGDLEIIKIWKELIGWVLEGQSLTMERIGEEMGHMWFESEIYEKGKEIILEKIDGVKIVKGDDGAVIGKIEQKYGVPDVVLIKSDGTALYHTQDLYLTMLKIQKYHPWKAIWVVGNEQITHFQRLFSLIDSIQLMPIDNLYHLAYGFVFDKEGKKMSSRTGDALSADELIDIVKAKVIKVMEDRRNSLDLDSTAEKIALGALKFAFLSTDPFKDLKFDIDASTSFNGKSGPYIMYSYARSSNILKKIDNIDVSQLVTCDFTPLSRSLSLKCLQYPEILVDAANNYSPSILADYLFDLAKLFNQFYELENVAGSVGDDLKYKKLLVTLVSKILEDGLSVLKINAVTEM